MRNKDEELRREGMAYALRIAKENGIDSLEEEWPLSRQQQNYHLRYQRMQ